MPDDVEEEKAIRSVALQSAERELVEAKEALERKTAELAQQREWFRVTLASIGDAVITTDTEAKVTFLNSVAEALTGWTFAEAGGQPVAKIFTIFNEDTREAVPNPIARILQEGVIAGLANHTTLIAKDGTETPIEDSAAPIRDAGGKTVGVVMVFHDVTERRRTARALRQSESSFRTLGDSIAQLAWAARADGFIYWYNRRWYEYTGTTPEQMEGWGWQSVHDPAVLPAVLEKWRTSIALGEPFEMEFPLRGADGIFRTFLTRAIPQRDSAGRVMQWFGTNTDVSEHIESEKRLRESAEALRAASRAKDEFLAALSHELRTPLTPVLMLAADMEQSAELPAAVRADFAMIRKNVELEARIIDDLLDLTRITRGKLALRFETVEVHGLIEHALAILGSDREAKRITVALDLAAAEHHVGGDGVRLQQVFWNVLKNAIKFTPEGGRIAIRSWNEDGHLRVAATDSGLGITAEEMPRIFTAFAQGREAAASRFGGLGLGLSISALLVREHRGRIWAESAGRDQGATFHLELPRADAPARIEPAAPPIAPQTLPRALRVLLVEDHEDTRAILQRLMTRWGHAVAIATTVAQAREEIARGAFDLLLSDVGLPDGTGYDVIAALREKSQIPAVAMSGFGMEADLARSHAAGFTEHIVKPVSAERLRELLTHFAAADS